MAMAVSTAIFELYFLNVCTHNNPAKKKSPNPKIIFPTFSPIIIMGTIGKEIATGSWRLNTVEAAETIVPVISTKMTSIMVKRAVKRIVVFHVNKLPTYIIIKIVWNCL